MYESSQANLEEALKNKESQMKVHIFLFFFSIEWSSKENYRDCSQKTYSTDFKVNASGSFRNQINHRQLEIYDA